MVPALKLSSDPRVIELADQLHDLVPLQSPADRPLVMLLAIALTRVSRALHWIEKCESEGTEVAERLTRDLYSWSRQSARLADQLGLSPTSRARLGLHVVRSQTELADYLRAAYGEGSDVEADETETDAGGES
jgi:hypothetical protein